MKFRLSSKYVVEFSMMAVANGVGGIRCEWKPKVPSKKRMYELYPAYQAARDKFMSSIGTFGVVIETTPEVADAVISSFSTKH